MNWQNLFARIENDAPLCCAASWDNSGIQVTGDKQKISRVAVALDPTLETVSKAVDLGVDAILTHHPMGLKPQFPNQDNAYYQTLALLIRSGTWLYAAHTSLDSQPDGPPAWLARSLGLHTTQILETTKKTTSLLIRIHPPFIPENITHPKIITRSRHADTLELVLREEDWPEVRHDLQARIGETISFHTVPLEEPSTSFGFGCIGDLDYPLEWRIFTSKLADILGKDYWTSIGRPLEKISRVAYCPGSGASLAASAFSRGAHVYITGDIKYHEAQSIVSQGLTLDVGHHVLEEKMMRVWYEQLSVDLGSQDVELIFIPSNDILRIEPCKTIMTS